MPVRQVLESSPRVLPGCVVQAQTRLFYARDKHQGATHVSAQHGFQQEFGNQGSQTPRKAQPIFQRNMGFNRRDNFAVIIISRPIRENPLFDVLPARVIQDNHYNHELSQLPMPVF